MEWFTGSKSDTNLMDEPAGKARLQMKKDSKARKAQETKELAKRNAEMKKRLKDARNEARTDDDLDDEEAGRMRKVLAEQSKAKREKEQKQLATKNDKIFAAIHSTTVRTDDDIMGAPPKHNARASARSFPWPAPSRCAAPPGFCRRGRGPAAARAGRAIAAAHA